MADEEKNGVRLVIHFDVKERIEATELARSLEAVAYLYREFLLEREGGHDKESDTNLYIATINDNCIYVEFAYYLKDVLEPAISIMEQFNTFMDFIDNIEILITYFMGTSHDSSFEPKNPKRKAKAILDLLNSIKDGIANKLTINATKNGEEDSKPPSVNLSGKDIPRVIKGAKRVIKNAEQAIKASNKATYKKEPKTVLLHFTRINTGNKGCAGFFGIIKDINDVEFPIDEFRIRVTKRFSDRIKKDIKDKNLNQVTDSYDAIVLERYKDGELKSYKIINLIKIIPNTHS